MDTTDFTEDDLANLLRAAAAAHAEYERQLERRDDDWPAWYAHYIYPRLPAQDLPSHADEPEKLPSTEPYLSQ